MHIYREQPCADSVDPDRALKRRKLIEIERGSDETQYHILLEHSGFESKEYGNATVGERGTVLQGDNRGILMANHYYSPKRSEDKYHISSNLCPSIARTLAFEILQRPDRTGANGCATTSNSRHGLTTAKCKTIIGF